MTKPLVLITGATGHIGFKTLVALLQAGYAARVSSRKLASAESLKHAASIKPYVDSVEFIEVPDMLADGAFDEAVKDVKYVLHLASPIPDETLTGHVKENYLDPAVKGTIGILESASKSPSVTRVVITSSVVVLAPKAGTSTAGPGDFAPTPNPDEVPSNPRVAYRASKILAHDASIEWMSTHQPSFDLLQILPSYVQGRNELVTRKEDVHNGSNDVLIDLVLGKQDPSPRFSSVVLVDDVAKCQIAALTRGKNGDHFIASYPEAIEWDDVTELTKQLFPNAVESGILPLGGAQKSYKVNHDTSKTTEVLGVELQGLEAMVESLVGQYVELASQ